MKVKRHDLRKGPILIHLGGTDVMFVSAHTEEPPHLGEVPETIRIGSDGEPMEIRFRVPERKSK